jgi:uncharacterized protein (TIGR02145 family)
MKLLVTSLLVFSLNVNLLAKPTAFQERAVKMIFDNVNNDENINSDTGNSLTISNSRVDAFVKKLFSSPSLYVKWLKALEISMRSEDDFASMNDFLNANKCVSCTYAKVIQAFEVKKSEHLVFWSGDYQTNLISDNGTGEKLELIIDKYIQVKHNTVAGIDFKVDGKVILGAKFKNYKLTWDYGTNMQPNDNKGSITFSEVFLDGKYIGHQFTGTLIRQENAKEVTKTFVGFTRVAENINDLSESGESGNENDSSSSTGDHPDLDIKTSIGLHSSGGVTINVLDNTTSEEGNTAKFSIVLNHKPIFKPNALKDSANGKSVLVISFWSSNGTEGRLKKFGAVFNEDNWSTPKEFTIYGQDDHLTDGNQPYQIIFATGWGYHTVNYKGRIIDPINLVNIETAGVTVKVLDGTTSEEGGTAKFSIVLNYEPIVTNPSIALHRQDEARTVVTTIGISTSDPSEGKFANGAIEKSITFTKDNWNIPREITVYGQNDNLSDGDTPYRINFSTSKGYAQGINYAGLKIDPVNLVNIGDYQDIDPMTGKPRMSVGFIHYPAKRFGTQIWTTENMRHYPSKIGNGFWSGFSDAKKETKYYSWVAAMNGESKEGAQGICAKGWHIPTDDDWKTLEGFLGMSKVMQDTNSSYRGTDQGAQMKIGGTSGFNVELLGYYAYNQVKSQGLSASFISSTSVNGFKYNSRYIGPYENDLVRSVWLVDKKNSGKWYFSNIKAVTEKNDQASQEGGYRTSGYYAEKLGVDPSMRINLNKLSAIKYITITPYSGVSPNNSNAVLFVSHKRVTADNGKTIEQLRRQFDMREIGTTSHWGVDSFQVTRLITTKQDPKAIWRGDEFKTTGSSVRCVKDSSDKSISSHSPKKIILTVDKPMTPIGFGDTVTSVTKNWSITPDIGNGLNFNTATGVLSGTPLVAQNTIDYQITTADDSKAVSSIAITVIDNAAKVSSIQIMGDNILQVGDSTQLNAMVSPSYASNKKLAWIIVGDKSKARISQTGELHALKSGHIMVVAAATDNSATYGTFVVSIAEQEKLMFNDKRYSIITSDDTGRAWLDRNLGATQACAHITDVACYGDLYQWGRSGDGHQLRSQNLVLSDIQATNITPDNGKFIINADDWTAPGVDDSGQKRQSAWINNSTNICPTGFSLPTLEELRAEINGSRNRFSLVNSKLKLSLNGLRNKAGQLQFVGIKGNYWTRDIAKTASNGLERSQQSKHLVIKNTATYAYLSSPRTIGMGVRCIKNLPPFISPSVNDLNAIVGTTIAPITFTNMGRIATKWEIAPALRAGLSFNAKTGTISGTPNEVAPTQRYRITASNTAGSDTAWVRISVNPIPILTRGVQIQDYQEIMTVGATVRLNVIISPSNASDHGITWSSSNTNVATVSKTGVVSAKSHGKTIISARANGNPIVFDLKTITVADYLIKDKAYNVIASPRTGRTWLDRNLGANQVCRTSTDMGCYGYLYQFGRTNDGHQKRLNTFFKGAKESTINPNTSAFIINGKDWTSADQSGALRQAVWGYRSNNNICPTGFRVPTIQEFKDEKIDANSIVFENFLGLPMSGKRISDAGMLIEDGVSGYYWSDTVSSNHEAQSLYFENNLVKTGSFDRNNGMNVRCIQDLNDKSTKYNQEPMEIAGIRYKTIRIGSQIWTAENMRHGNADGIYSYRSNANNDAINGKYYTWSAAMGGSTRKYTQGICASGWRIPTIQEWNILKAHLDDNQEGTQLKKWGGSGFDALMVGKVETGYLGLINFFKSLFTFSGRKAFFWTSEKKLGLASFKSLDDFSTTIQQGTTAPNEQAFSVRCIKNPPSPMTVAGINYDTVEIGNQIWTVENMRHNASHGHSSNENISSDYAHYYGKSYDWEAAMNGSKVEGAQGICASDWHIPTDGDWKTLEKYLGMNQSQRNTQWTWRGSNQGYHLKKKGYSGFYANMPGRTENLTTPNHHYTLRGKESYFWTSSRNKDTPSLVIFRSLKDSSDRIYRGVNDMNIYGLSVRCIKDANKTPYPAYTPWR